MSGPALRSLHERLLRALLRERSARGSQIAELLSLPIEERVEKGECVVGLRLVREERSGEIVFSCPENLSRFRRGDKLSLGYGENPEHGVIADYISYDPVRKTMRLSHDRFDSFGWDELDLGRPLVLDRRGSDFAQVAHDALRAVYGRGDDRSLRIRGILERTGGGTEDEAERHVAAALAGRLDLDESQREAFLACWCRRDFHLVQGPPGSGKTHLIAHLASCWARAGRRVLITAQTHRAVNNALRSTARLGDGLRVVKLGEDHNADDLPTGVLRVRSGKDLTAASPGDVIGATVFALKSFWESQPFDRVVFDEAAQIPIAHALCGMLCGRRYVFVGDHKQLGPIVEGDHEDEIAHASIFEHLLAGDPVGARGPVTLLRTTYRMNAGITDFPSRRFYGGALAPAPSCSHRRFPLRPGGPLDDVFDPDLPAVMVTIAHVGHRMRCGAEARLVADLAEDLLARQGFPADQIAIVTPFRAQVQSIACLLHEKLASAGTPDPVLPVIDTVERIQGQEREIVIVSLACSDPEIAARDAAFLFSPKRLNVTLTRAKTKLIVVASPLVFEALPADLEQLKQASLFARLYHELPRLDLTDRYTH